jgi:hypothetical protein
MKISFIAAWYDCWIGLFYDQKKQWLYVFPIPFVGIVVKFKSKCDHSYKTSCYNKDEGTITKTCIHCLNKKVIKK